MKNRIKFLTIVIMILTMTGLAAAPPSPGGVQACDSTGDDVNLIPGTLIYYKGVNLVSNSATSWQIYDKAEGVTVFCPPDPINPVPGMGCAKLLASGSGGPTNSDGDISPPTPTTWSISAGDFPGHPYRLLVTIGGNPEPFREFYTKNDSFSPTPELGSIVLMSAGLFGLLLVSRKYRSK
jgi:hypothetical protein